LGNGYLIRDVRREDWSEWLELWNQYLVHYKAELPADRTDFLWNRLFDETDPVECLVAEVDGAVVGMAQFVPHIDTWEEAPMCYLQDLQVAEPFQGRGIGRALITAVDDLRRSRGWCYLYWQTEHHNQRARILYDALTGGVSEFVVYRLGLDEPSRKA
jgi:GNAT superfamily N-acetyltransferase